MTEEAGEYRQAIARALAAASSRATNLLPAEEARSRALRHAARPESQRQLFAANSGQESRIEVCKALIDESFAVRRQDPSRMLALAQSAYAMALMIEAAPGESLLVEDFRAEALATLATAHRHLGGMRDAASCWEALDHRIAEVEISAHARAVVLAYKAAFHRVQRDRLQQAACLREARDLFTKLGQPDRAGLLGLTYGHLHWDDGRYREAFTAVVDVAATLEADTEPERFADVFQALALSIDALGHPVEALLLLHNAREVWDRGRGSLHEARVRWLQARILVKLEQPAAAVQLFEGVRTAFAKASLPLPVAQVSVEQALAYLRLGQPEEVERVALESYPVFLSQDLPHEATLALLLFVKAAKRRRTTERALGRLLTRLKTLAGQTTSS
ncbi:MAG TPA: hypothetical protein VF017_17785 [Thermoanaerobaculia bacterium]|nr:hypothetical protein [Thermoanaerobaculia bacterium]